MWVLVVRVSLRIVITYLGINLGIITHSVIVCFFFFLFIIIERLVRCKPILDFWLSYNRNIVRKHE